MGVQTQHILEVWQQLTTAENIVVKVAQAANISPMSVMPPAQMVLVLKTIVGARQVKKGGSHTHLGMLSLLGTSAQSWVSR